MLLLFIINKMRRGRPACLKPLSMNVCKTKENKTHLKLQSDQKNMFSFYSANCVQFSKNQSEVQILEPNNHNSGTVQGFTVLLLW